jgi:hypothetical protein
MFKPIGLAVVVLSLAAEDARALDFIPPFPTKLQCDYIFETGHKAFLCQVQGAQWECNVIGGPSQGVYGYTEIMRQPQFVVLKADNYNHWIRIFPNGVMEINDGPGFRFLANGNVLIIP